MDIHFNKNISQILIPYLNYSTNINTNSNLKKIENENNCNYLRQKIIVLKNEIDKKNKLINEYTELTKESKKKFQQIILMNKKESFNVSQKYTKIIQKYKNEFNKLMKQNQDLIKENNDIKNYNKSLEDIIIKLNIDKENKNNNEENGKVIKKLLMENFLLKKQIRGNSNYTNNLNDNIGSIKNNEKITDIYYLEKDINISDLKLQKEEVDDVFWLSIEEIKKLIEEDKIRKSNITPFFSILKYLNK